MSLYKDLEQILQRTWRPYVLVDLLKLKSLFSKWDGNHQKDFLKLLRKELEADRIEETKIKIKKAEAKAKKKLREEMRAIDMKSKVKPGMIIKCQGTRDSNGIREVLELKDQYVTCRKIYLSMKSKEYIRDEYFTTHMWKKVQKIIANNLVELNNKDAR